MARIRSGSPAVATAAAVALTGVAALHVAWGRGSTFPFRTRAGLNDAVIGRAATPSPAACNGVAAILLSAAVLVARAGTGGGRPSRVGATTVAAALATRAGFGFAGHTDVLVPGSDSPAFRRMDRRCFSPACALLAAGAARAALSA